MNRLTSMCVLVGLSVALVATGCRKVDDGDEFRGGVPTRETVALHVAGAPVDGASTTTASATGALLAQRADTYVVTRAVTAVVNGGTWAVLTLVRTIVAFPPTSVDKLAMTAVWGPHTDPLSPNTWRLTVHRLEAHKFSWALEARAKTADDSAFQTIISGTHTAEVDAMGDHVEGFGSGAFLIDWDAAATLPEHDENVGKAAFTYSHLLADSIVHVDVDFTGIEDKKLRDGLTPERFNAVYRYVATPGMGGELRYAEDKDNYPGMGNTGSAKEHFTIHSRWLEDGTGRCDVANGGGDLPATGHASECWDSNFKSDYFYPDYAPMTGWGAESACTGFPTAVYAGL
jgi:hypothetical protein